MASSSSPKSNSSASRAQKPTFRRASKSARPVPSAHRPAAARTKGPAKAAPKAGARRSQAPAASRAGGRPKRLAAPAATRSGAASKRVPRASAPAARPKAAAAAKPKTAAAAKPRTTAPGRPSLKLKAAPARGKAQAAAAKPGKAVLAASILSAPVRKLNGSLKRPVPASKGPSGERPAKSPARPAGIGSIVPGKVVAIAVAIVAAIAIGAIVVVNSPIFSITDVVVNGSEHVSKEMAEQLVDVPAGSTLFNVDTGKIEQQLEQSPWVSSVEVGRSLPGTLTITPVERKVAAIAYISSDDVAWAIDTDGCWIAPVSLSVAVDSNGAYAGEAVVSASEAQNAASADAASADGSSADAASSTDGDAASDASDGASASDASSADAGASSGTLPDGTTRVTGVAAARAIAKHFGAVLFVDVPADSGPTSRGRVTSDVVKAGLAYATGFSSDFVSQINEISLSSVDAISAYLSSGVEVALGSPDDIERKELVVTRLLEQQSGVTYINVRTPDHYTFRSAPTS